MSMPNAKWSTGSGCMRPEILLSTFCPEDDQSFSHYGWTSKIVAKLRWELCLVIWLWPSISNHKHIITIYPPTLHWSWRPCWARPPAAGHWLESLRDNGFWFFLPNLVDLSAKWHDYRSARDVSGSSWHESVTIKAGRIKARAIAIIWLFFNIRGPPNHSTLDIYSHRPWWIIHWAVSPSAVNTTLRAMVDHQAWVERSHHWPLNHHDQSYMLPPWVINHHNWRSSR